MWSSLLRPSAYPSSRETERQREKEREREREREKERQRDRMPKIGMVLALPGSLHALPIGGPPKQYNTNR